MKTAVVEYKDIYKLHPEVWLNDEIINFYMEMLSDRSKENTGVLPDIHCFNTFFYSTIRESGYSKVKRWTKRVDIFAKDLVFVPINQSLHWVLAVFDMKRTLVRVYDSLGGGHDYTLKLLLNYLREEHLDKKKKVLDTSDWTLESPKNIPHQKNGSDCGVFTCTFAERLSRNLPFDFTQKDMVLIRRRMVFDISQKHIS
ncbi:Senp1 mutant in complex with sumo-1 [Spinellus fusiger]|nr:Senp1 mutant in complex with sumo-1 [Spinellus fusiger]